MNISKLFTNRELESISNFIGSYFNTECTMSIRDEVCVSVKFTNYKIVGYVEYEFSLILDDSEFTYDLIDGNQSHFYEFNIIHDIGRFITKILNAHTVIFKCRLD